MFLLECLLTLKYRDGVGKYILKKLARKYLPPEVVDKIKERIW